MPRPKTHHSLIEATERRNQALQLRKQGGTYRMIAEKMIEKFGKDQLPKGYDERYVFNDVMAILNKLNKEIAENADEVRRLELERLDTMFIKQFEKAVKGDSKSVDACLRIMKRRDDYLGLSAAKKIDASGVNITVSLSDD